MGSLDAAFGVEPEPSHLMRWELDPITMVGTNLHGHSVALRPFLGTIGLTPDLPGWQSAWTPRHCGGNIDCKELIAGSKLSLPIAVPGALLSVGDGHARQGNGEVGGMAIECMLERVELRLQVRDDLTLTAPRAWTPAGWVTLGFDEDLDRAAEMAVNGMLQLLEEQYQLHRKDAVALASVVVDVQVTQLVNGVRGVHAVLPHDAVLDQ
jgi:acetamidase/formamidase